MIDVWCKIRGYLAGAVALVACPCHLPLSLPLVLSLTAGTAAGTTVGVFFERNLGVVFAIPTALFVGGMILAFHWLGSGAARSGDSCPPKPVKGTASRREYPGLVGMVKRGEERAS